MDRDDVIARLHGTEAALRALGVESLFLFGSYARGDARPNSDIDVFVDPEPTGGFGFMAFMDAFETIESAVAAKVDYGTRSGLHPMLRDTIEREAVRIF